MQTPTELANIALGHIGAAKVHDFHEASASAETLRLHWATTRDACLRSRHWNFALRRKTLSRLATPPEFGFAYAYQLPSDYLLATEVNGLQCGTGEATHEIEGDTLLTDDEQCHLRYVRRVEETSLWDASFEKFFTLQLAAEIAPFLSSSQGLRESLLQQSEVAKLKAAGPDNLETRPWAIPATKGAGWASRVIGPAT